MSRNICSAVADTTRSGPSPTRTAGPDGARHVLAPLARRRARGQHGLAPGDDRLEQPHRGLARRPAGVARAVVVVVGLQARCPAVARHPGDPVHRRVADVLRHRRRGRAEIVVDVARVVARVERRDHPAAVEALPEPDVEGHALRRLLRRVVAADRRRRVPRQLLRGEALQAGVREDARERRREPEAVGQHVLRACLAELAAEELGAVENLPEERLGRRRVHVALLHGRPGGEPAAGRHVLLHPLVVGRVVLLHHPVPVRAAEVEHVVRVLLEQREVVVQRPRQELADRLRVVPAPLRVEMGIADHVQRRRRREVRTRAGRGRRRAAGREDEQQQGGERQARAAVRHEASWGWAGPAWRARAAIVAIDAAGVNVGGGRRLEAGVSACEEIGLQAPGSRKSISGQIFL